MAYTYKFKNVEKNLRSFYGLEKGKMGYRIHRRRR
jgi:hypothetical protein